MNEWLKKVTGKAKNLWKNWKPVQKVILIGIVVVVIVAIIVVANLSAKPSTVKLFNAPVTDQVALTKILDRISQENVEAYASPEGYISVDDDRTARLMREILISENLVPSTIDPWAGFYDRSWSTTDADQNVKLKNTIQTQLKQHIETIEGITMADVTIVLPETELFTADQDPVTASVILKTTTDEIYRDKKRILGIQKLILSAVQGLTEDNLIITDAEGNQINDFEGMAASDRIDLVAKQQKLIHQEEDRIRKKVLTLLQGTFDPKYCREVGVTVEMDFSERSSEATEYSPIKVRDDNPDTPYDDSEFRDTLPLSQQTVTKEWQGTGFNPEGPAGVEGQNPPVYSDNSNTIGKSTETGTTQNNVINTKQISEVYSPQIKSVSVSVNIDGKWEFETDEDGEYIIESSGLRKRKYIPRPEEDIIKAQALAEAAIGYNRNRGDKVEVTSFAYDRDAEHRAEDAAYFAKQQRNKTILLILIGVAVVLISFILFRIISREVERKRREKEARLLAEQQAARERALWEAKDDNMEVTMSVEETRRMELQENAISMAKEHPEDVAMLIRTWLMEE